MCDIAGEVLRPRRGVFGRSAAWCWPHLILIFSRGLTHTACFCAQSLGGCSLRKTKQCGCVLQAHVWVLHAPVSGKSLVATKGEEKDSHEFLQPARCACCQQHASGLGGYMRRRSKLGGGGPPSLDALACPAGFPGFPTSHGFLGPPCFRTFGRLRVFLHSMKLRQPRSSAMAEPRASNTTRQKHGQSPLPTSEHRILVIGTPSMSNQCSGTFDRRFFPLASAQRTKSMELSDFGIC